MRLLHYFLHSVSKSNDRIVGGSAVQKHSLPWQVSLVAIDRNRFPWCGGTIISDRHVLTAAHCMYIFPDNYTLPLEPLDKNLIGVVVGEHDWTDTSHGEEYGVNCKHVHPRYDPNTGIYPNRIFDWDVAILVLNRKIVIGRKQQPACLPPARRFTDRYLGGKNLLVSGWGQLAYDEYGPDRLNSVELPFIPWGECKNLLPEGWVKRIMICAGNVEDGGVSACYGDSGGITKIILILEKGKSIT